jgi:AcrR family transcriptional regulator
MTDPAATVTGSAPSGSVRSRILDAALRLMSEHGSASASMRSLAAACELNVATLYHYFPSKADLFRAVIEERRYFDRLGSEAPPIDPDVAPTDRLADLVEWLWVAALDEEAVWRLLVGEAIRKDPVATASARSLITALEPTFERWLIEAFPELAVRADVAARLLRAQVFTLVVDHLATGVGGSAEAARARAADLAPVLFEPPVQVAPPGTPS